MSYNTLEHEPWTAESGEQFLCDLSATLNQFGYEGRIVGSIATGENSDESDLDILLSPTDAARELDNFDIEGLYYAHYAISAGIKVTWTRTTRSSGSCCPTTA